MKFKAKSLFPDDLSDEAAAVLSDFLQELALAFDTHYLAQLRRYNSRQRNLYDPEQPWLTPPRQR